MDNSHNPKQANSNEQYFIDAYKKQSRLNWYITQSNAAAMQKAWEKCFSLSLLLSPLPECAAKVTEVSYGTDSRLTKLYKDSVNIAYACSEAFAPFCGISLYSLLENADSSKNYDIIIIHSGSISEVNKRHITLLANGRKNVSVRFVNCENTKTVEIDNYFSYFSIDVYLRCLLMTDFFAEYDRFIYLDSDTIAEGDISMLYTHNMHGSPIGAVRDMCMEYLANSGSSLVLNGTLLSYSYYIKSVLGIGSVNDYFNTGVTLLDISYMRQDKTFEKLKKLVYEKRFYCYEQCILNYLYKGNICYLPLIWNMQDITDVYGNCKDYVGEKTLSYIKWSKPRAKITHFIGPEKPWRSLSGENGELFSKYASHTVWFKAIAYSALADKAENFLKKYENQD